MSKMGEFQQLQEIDGLEISAISADLYGSGRDDLCLFYFKDGANYGAVYTSNSICSESITWNRNIRKKFIKALMVNTKNANTFTGSQGQESLESISKSLAKNLTLKEAKKEDGTTNVVKPNEILFASTGVIGEKFPTQQIKGNIPNLVDKLRERQNKFVWFKAASSIMTTDTRPKLAYEECKIWNKDIRLCGIAKGSGMISPNMATMLAFVFTDADIPSIYLKSLLKKAVSNSFNAITVDSDTSTNDMVAIFSTNKVKTGKIYNVLDPKLKDFEKALQRLLLNMAKQIVSDGEGAKKFITVRVTNARSQQMAKSVAFSIANSPLFKTAMAGEDPNWGRIIMAIGKSEEKISPEKIEIKFGDLKVAEKGKISEEYDEAKLKEYMKWNSLVINVNLKLGQGSFECYTCDFTNEYVKINADYRN
uniref:Arginine biosynthesis bifunctional protein ArgJ n=1 Tax=uncultured SAR11 cluster alpha proteobacterium H17925_23J24 TaxID=715036 RepID=E7C9V9_9PROT|nr:N-acetylglutamate synthase [uncultured SAR11 cluster alpha proteobacterium H17925_23J24]